MADNETCVVRIVNLDDSFTEFSLRQMIMLKCQPRGNIKSLYLRKDNNVNLNLLFAYVVFEYGYDAVKIVELLHGHTHIEKKFEVELIGPKLKYQRYEDAADDITIDRLFQLKDEEHRRLENLRKMTAGRAFMQSPPVNQRLREQAFGNKYGNKCNVCKGAHSTSTCPIFRGGNVADNKTPAASGGETTGVSIFPFPTKD